jgi:pilus assembly protein CpaB
MVYVLAVSQDIELGGELIPDLLTEVLWPRTELFTYQENGQEVQYYFWADTIEELNDTKEELRGRRVRYPIKEKTILVRPMLRPAVRVYETDEYGSEYSVRIPHEQVAISIPINRLTSVSYAPRPGDHVDVIGTFLFIDIDTDFQTRLPNHTGMVVAPGPPNPETGEPTTVQLTAGVSNLGKEGPPDPETGQRPGPSVLAPGIFGRVEVDPVLGQAIYVSPSEDQRPRMVSQLLLQDATVLWVGEFPLPGQEQQQQAAAEQEEQQAAEGEQAPPPVVVPELITLIMRPQDAVAINYILQSQKFSAARLSLALRAANDESRPIVVPVTLQFLLERYQIPVPARLPYGLGPRIDELP